jgi:hypothetical protein
VSQSRKRAFCHSGRSEESNEINMLRMKDSSAKDSKWHYDTACSLAGLSLILSFSREIFLSATEIN